MRFDRRQLLRAAGVLLLPVFALSACDSGDDYDGPALPALAMDARILAFGDSLTYGTGASADDAYPAQLARLIQREVINAGIPGETTSEGLQRLPAVLDDTRPDLVLLCLGGNDMLRRGSRADMHDNLRAMVDILKARGIPIVLIAVPELKGLSLTAEPRYAQLADANNIALENTILAEVLGQGRLKSDTIHPNDRGYRRVAEALAALLRAAGAV